MSDIELQRNITDRHFMSLLKFFINFFSDIVQIKVGKKLPIHVDNFSAFFAHDVHTRFDSFNTDIEDFGKLDDVYSTMLDDDVFDLSFEMFGSEILTTILCVNELEFIVSYEIVNDFNDVSVRKTS